MKRLPDLDDANGDGWIVLRAAAGDHGPGAQRLAEVGLTVVEMLLKKNIDYGGSAWKKPVLAAGMTPREAIQCRMSDKIARLSRLLDGSNEPRMVVDEAVEDTMKDLAGYCVLWLAYQEDADG